MSDKLIILPIQILFISTNTCITYFHCYSFYVSKSYFIFSNESLF